MKPPDFKAKDLNWEKMGGLIPTVVQDRHTGRVLMLAFMNREALEKSFGSGELTFWSRTRGRLWTKGETSGNHLRLQEIRSDCDNDSLLAIVEPAGPACHTGRHSCFGSDRDFAALEFLGYLEQLIAERRKEMPEGSYTTRLFREGPPEIAKKLGEEAVELIVSSQQNPQRLVEESADLIYHLLVFLRQHETDLQDVIEELRRRHGL